MSLAFHAVVLTLAMYLVSITGLVPAQGGTRTREFVVTVPPPEPPPLVNRGPDVPRALEQDDVTADTWTAFDVDLQPIAARRDRLFAFLTADLAFLDHARDTLTRSQNRLRAPIGVASRRQNRLPPLRLTDAAFQRLVDSTWSRRDRWQSFQPIAQLAPIHDPDDGQLPNLLRAYVDQNLLQPYDDQARRDPRLWALLRLAADHIDVLEFVGRFVQQHPSSRATVELLFLADELAQANRDTLLVLTTIDPEHDLAQTRQQDARAFALAQELRRLYGDWLEVHDLRHSDIAGAYDGIRMSILQAIVDLSPGGYGVADARFLMGKILWNRDDTADAIEVWKRMGADERNSYAEFRSQIERAIGAGGEPDIVEIVRILGAERRRWRQESASRLLRFGYTLNQF